MKRLTKEQAQERMPAHIKLLTWSGNKASCKARCTKHKQTFVSPLGETLYKSHGCPLCSKEGYTKSKNTKWLAAHLDIIKTNSQGRVTFVGPYASDRTETVYRCSVHGEFRAKPCFAQGRRQICVQCEAESKQTQVNKHNKNRFLSLLEDTRKNPNRYTLAKWVHNQKALIRCEKHGKFSVSPSKVKQRGEIKYGCKQCLSEWKASGAGQRKTHSWFVRELKRVSPTLKSLEKYSGSLKHMAVQCRDCKHKWHVQPYSILHGVGCPRCSKGNRVSKPEQELFEFIKSLCSDARQSDRKLITPKELDIVVDSKKLAFELNGIHWHAERPTYHRDKSRAVEALGYRLIHIYEDDWYYRQNAVKSLVRQALGVTLCAWQARKLELRSTNRVTKVRKFFERYHIQGAPKASLISYGLFDGHNCVAVMSFDRVVSVRGTKSESCIYELVRFASKGSVAGGASRLFSNFVRDYKPKQIVSYSANDWFTGHVYEILGFKLVKHVAPDYKAVINGRRVHKSSVRRSRLPALLGDKFDPALSERENCLKNGIVRVFDSGKKKWIWTA